MTRDALSQMKDLPHKALLAAIVESSDDAIVSKDLTGTITSWNRGAQRIFGYTAEEMIGESIMKLIPPDRPDEEPLILERIRRGERIEHFETVRRRKDGVDIDVSVTISPIRDSEGRIVGASKVGRNISEQKRLEEDLRRQAEELAQQHRQKDEFLAVLAHELRNPLAPMRTALEILRLRPNDISQVLRVRETLDRQVKNLSRLVEDLLDASRLTQGKMHPRMELLDLTRLVRYNCQAYEGRVQAAGLGLEIRTPDTPVWAMGDPTRLDQMLDNLLENAIKFTDRGGTITVSLKIVGEQARISVRDTGVGIDPAMLPHLFQTFTQADQSLERSRGGLGLGLAIVKGLAELHGGTADVRSEGLGRGAEFLLELPLVAEPKPTHEGPAAHSAHRQSRRVLVVEDNRDAADSMAELLRILGFEVQVAYRGEEGVEAARLFHPEIILCDIGLPGLNGYQVARQLRSDPQTAGICLIALTGYGTEADTEQALAAGFDQHLIKPVDPDRLLCHLPV